MVGIKNTFEHVKVKVPPKPRESTKEERQSHEATHGPFRAWCEICVKVKSPDGRHAKQVEIQEHIPVIEFDYAFATDKPGGPKISMMVDGCDRLNSWIDFSCCGKEKRWPGRFCDAEFPNCIDRLGLVKAELKCDQEPSTLGVANAFDQAVSIHSSDCDCNAKRLERELGAWRTSEFDNLWTPSTPPPPHTTPPHSLPVTKKVRRPQASRVRACPPVSAHGLGRLMRQRRRRSARRGAWRRFAKLPKRWTVPTGGGRKRGGRRRLPKPPHAPLVASLVVDSGSGMLAVLVLLVFLFALCSLWFLAGS